jgi:4-hydroxybutyrate CoA-transferase
MARQDTNVSDWQVHHRERTVTPEVAVSAIRPDDHVYNPLGHIVDPVIWALLGTGRRVNLTAGAPGGDLSWLTPELAEHFRLNILFGLPGSRQAINDFRADYTPWWVYTGHKAADEGRPGARPVDVCLIRVTPPNRAGWCCLGNSLWDAKLAAGRARTTIAVVSDQVLRTFGDTWIPATDIDWFVEADPTAPEAAERIRLYFEGIQAQAAAQAADPTIGAIARHVAAVVRDGDTVQVGTGSTTGAIVWAGALDERNDLGYFAELTVPGLVRLAHQGVITGLFLRSHPYKFVTTMAGGLPDENEIINDNPAFEFYGTEYMHDPAAIARNDNMVAINNALMVDLAGQIAAGQFGTTVWSGTGGQLAYQLGASMSKGGRAVTVLPSTAQHGTTSRILAEMPPGQIITIPRDLADIVITEHGVAHLLNKTQRERARALIDIAHPRFRDDLLDRAKHLYGT